MATVLLLVLGVVLYRFAAGAEGFALERFTGTLKELDAGYSCLAIFFIILSYLGRAVRWEVMMRPLGTPLSFGKLIVATTVGFTAVVLLGRAGEFVRPWLIAKRSGSSFSAQVAIWVLERIYDLLIVILFFGYGLIYLTENGKSRGLGAELNWVLSMGGWVALAGGACCMGFLLLLRFMNGGQRAALAGAVRHLPGPVAERLRPVVENFLEGAAASCEGEVQGRVVLYTFLEWVIIAGCQWAVFQAFPVTRALGWSDVVSIVGLVSLGSVIQLPGIGGGMQVAAVAVLTQVYGVGLEAATSVALVLWVTTFVLVVPVGLWLGVKEGLKWNQIGRLQ